MTMKSLPVESILLNFIFCLVSRSSFISTSSTFRAEYLDFRQSAIAFAVSRAVRQGMSRSTARRLMRTESACGFRPLAEVDMT